VVLHLLFLVGTPLKAPTSSRALFKDRYQPTVLEDHRALKLKYQKRSQKFAVKSE